MAKVRISVANLVPCLRIAETDEEVLRLENAMSHTDPSPRLCFAMNISLTNFPSFVNT